MRRNIGLVLAALLVAAVTAVYSNHFENAFHFDDFHTVTGNPHIRSLKNIPGFFKNAETFSTLLSNRSYRPLISASLALDYWAGGGLKPFYFHLSTFLWFLLLLVLMFLLLRSIFDLSKADPLNIHVACFAAAWYGLHPAMAETVNYVIQRGDLLSTLGVEAGLYLFALSVAGRKYYLYLIPVALGQLCKPPALIFPLILLTYILLFEGRAAAFRKCVPALLVTASMAILQAKMTPPTYVAGATSAYAYRITQPFVALHYFGSFFLPLGLTADTDRAPLESAANPEALLGFVFVAALLCVAVACSRPREWRPVAFGLFWFLLALLPTSLFALAEVENDHRMFFPFAGLAMAVVWAAWLTLPRKVPVLATLAVVVLAAYGWGAYRRNRVWRTEESLWLDVIQKSPRNGRGLMNYGLTQMQLARYPVALDYFQRAAAYTPAYPFLEVNLGIVLGELHRDQEAEGHFRRAIQLAPVDAQVHYYYGRWLNLRGRGEEALREAESAAAMNPSFLDAKYLLLEMFAGVNDWGEVRRVAGEIDRLAPGDATSARYLLQAVAGEEQAPTAESYLQQSLRYHQAGKYQACIESARAALRLKPDYAEAYNNIAAAYASMSNWDEAIAAAQAALKINPNYQLAKNNLAWSESRKKMTAERK